jgi:hypothetical protein
VASVRVQTVAGAIDGLRSEIPKVSEAILENLGDHVHSAVKNDYRVRCQQSFYPIRHPITGKVISELRPSEIAKSVRKELEQKRVVIFVPPQTKEDVEARKQELYGGRPLQIVRSKMQDTEYVNRVLSKAGLQGVKARSK